MLTTELITVVTVPSTFTRIDTGAADIRNKGSTFERRVSVDFLPPERGGAQETLVDFRFNYPLERC